MPTTFGDMRGDLSLMPCGVSVHLTVIENKINNRLEQYIKAHPWTRLRIDDRIATVAKYATGTLAIDNGATELVLTDGVFTAEMDGRRIRIAGGNTIYTFGFVDAANGTIDTPYEGEDATEATFELFQNVYALNSPMVEIDSIKSPRIGLDLDEIAAETMAELTGFDSLFGPATTYAPAPDTTGFVRQIELYPFCDIAEALPVRGMRGVDKLQGDEEQFPPWVSIPCLQAGVEADLLALKGDMAGYQMQEARYQMLLKDAMAEDDRRRPLAELNAAPEITSYRDARRSPYQGRFINWRSGN